MIYKLPWNKNMWKMVSFILFPLVIILISFYIIINTPYFSSQRYQILQVVEEKKNVVHYDYKTINTEHFCIKYIPKSENKARWVAFYVESFYDSIARIFDIELERKMMVVLEDYKQFKPNQFVTGFHQNGVIYVCADDICGVPVYITVSHELSHAMLHYKFNGAYMLPRWLDEGIAVNIETSITGNNKVNNGKFYSISELDAIFEEKPNRAYTQCAAIIEYIVETYGEEALWDFISKLTYNHMTLDEAVLSTFEKDITLFDQQCYEYCSNIKEVKGSFEAS